MLSIKIEVDDQAVRRALAELARRVGTIGTALAMVGEQIVQRVDKRFSTETGPDGARWAKLRPATLRRKRGTKILTESGDLRGSIVRQVIGTTLVVSAHEPYAAIHQFGGTVNRKAGNITTRHRTNARGELLRSEIMGGKGLIFAKASHKRVLERSFGLGAYKITIPPRPYFPVRADGSLYPDEQRAILAAIEGWIRGR